MRYKNMPNPKIKIQTNEKVLNINGLLEPKKNSIKIPKSV